MKSLITFREEDDCLAVVEVHGRLTAGPLPADLGRLFRDLVNAGYVKVILNVMNVPQIDSVGLRELVKAYTLVRKSGGTIKLLNVREPVMRVLRLVRLDLLIEIHTNEMDALVSFYPFAAREALAAGPAPVRK